MTDTFKNDCLAIIKLAMETPEAKAHIMCEWVAHCQFFAVRVYMGGWTEGNKPQLSAESHANGGSYKSAFHSEPSLVLAKIQALLA